MNKNIAFTLLLALCLSCEAQTQTQTQTYIGEVLYRNTYQYIKLVCSNDSCTFSMPYIDNDRNYKLPLQLATEKSWTVQRGVENWNFHANLENGKLTGELHLPMGTQPLLLLEQKEALSMDAQTQYEGIYRDAENRRAIVYSRNGYLHLLSPYSEEAMSLKPVGENSFWSVSGEVSKFSDLQKNKFRKLIVSIRTGGEQVLYRLPDFTVEELFIAVGEDSLFAKLYLPASEEKVPACLILPGGGGIGLENYEYEARYFAAYGMASLVFDKSGNGRSKGSGNFRRQTFEDKNKQYIALFNYLKNHPKVDADKVGVHGPSEGGRLALMMAIDLQEELAFAIATAGPLMTMQEGQLYAIDQHHRIRGLPEKDNIAILNIWQSYFNEIREGKINPATIAKANQYRSLYQRIFLPPDITEIPATPNAKDLANDRVVREAHKIVSPILLQYGENDQRVNGPKSVQNFLPKLAPSTKVNTIFYHRGNHSFMTPEFEICPGYLDDKMRWLKGIGIL